MLFNVRVSFATNKKLAKYVKTVEQKAARDKKVASAPEHSAQRETYEAERAEWLARPDVVSALSMEAQYNALSEFEKDVITLATGHFPGKLAEDAAFDSVATKLTKELHEGKIKADDIRAFVNAAGHVYGRKFDKYNESTLVETLASMKSTGFGLDADKPITTRARSNKQWAKQLALYLYACIVSTEVNAADAAAANAAAANA